MTTGSVGPAPGRRELLSRQQGTTLLELLLAVSVLAMVTAMVVTGMSATLKVVEGTRETEAIYHRAQVTLTRISEDLMAALLDDDVEFIGKQGNLGEGRADSLRFTSMAHIVFDPENDQPGLGFISYTVEEDEENDRGLLLLRGDRLIGPADTEDKEQPEDGLGLLLCDGLRSVRFTYLDAEGKQQDEWDTTVEENAIDPEERRLPAVVTCTLEFWVDSDNDQSISFTTSVALPAGLIRPKKEDA